MNLRLHSSYGSHCFVTSERIVDIRSVFQVERMSNDIYEKN